jgi:isochorismate synthase
VTAAASPSAEGRTAPTSAEGRRALDSTEHRRAIVLRTLPAPTMPLEVALAALPGDAPLLFDAPEGPLGAARGARARGGGRVATGAGWGGGLVGAVERARGGHGAPPRVYGAIAFDPGPQPAPFESFGECTFVLPRLAYALEGGAATLTLACREGEPAERLLAEALGRLERAHPLDPRPAELVARELPEPAFRALVEAALAEIAAARLDKVVLARATEVEAGLAFDVPAVLGRLAAEVGCARFAISAGEACFLGATPERLIARRGLAVRTEALAGSIPAGADEAVLESRKERAEHAHVARAIEARLAPLCDLLQVAPLPARRQLRHGVHLCTPITGRLRDPVHVLDLVRALHPTPAVGGVPTAAARAFQTRFEPVPRGLYAGPVGWFDAAGDGDFWVGIRSGVVTGALARVYAGAGIVAGSDPGAEYRETGWKQRALLGALGGAP